MSLDMFTFIVGFGNEPKSQLEGAEMLYKLLANINLVNSKFFEWTKGVSADIESDEFSFSVAGQAFFLPLLYKYASSQARVSDKTYVIFNSHCLFELLRRKIILDKNGAEISQFEKLKRIIRSRQSQVHPFLADYGSAKEFDQYAMVDPEVASLTKETVHKVLGQCPFHKKGDL